MPFLIGGIAGIIGWNWLFGSSGESRAPSALNSVVTLAALGGAAYLGVKVIKKL